MERRQLQLVRLMMGESSAVASMDGRELSAIKNMVCRELSAIKNMVVGNCLRSRTWL